jgi:hypothetical protein
MWRSVNAFIERSFERSDFFASAMPEHLNRDWTPHVRDVPSETFLIVKKRSKTSH